MLFLGSPLPSLTFLEVLSSIELTATALPFKSPDRKLDFSTLFMPSSPCPQAIYRTARVQTLMWLRIRNKCTSSYLLLKVILLYSIAFGQGRLACCRLKSEWRHGGQQGSPLLRTKEQSFRIEVCFREEKNSLIAILSNNLFFNYLQSPIHFECKQNFCFIYLISSDWFINFCHNLMFITSQLLS